MIDAWARKSKNRGILVALDCVIRNNVKASWKRRLLVTINEVRNHQEKKDISEIVIPLLFWPEVEFAHVRIMNRTKIPKNTTRACKTSENLEPIPTICSIHSFSSSGESAAANESLKKKAAADKVAQSVVQIDNHALLLIGDDRVKPPKLAT